MHEQERQREWWMEKGEAKEVKWHMTLQQAEQRDGEDSNLNKVGKVTTWMMLWRKQQPEQGDGKDVYLNMATEKENNLNTIGKTTSTRQ